MGGGRVSAVDGLADRTSPGWSTARFVVAGFGTAGYACADSLLQAGAAHVLAVDDRDTPALREQARILETLGAAVRLGPGSTATLPGEVDVVVTSPGWRPSAPLLTQAAGRGVPVWSEIELAWRLRDPAAAAPWLCVTGTNGKTTTVRMLASVLRAAGLRTVAAGNVGLPLLAAVMDPEPYDVIAVELSSYQLHFTSSMSAHSAAVLNLAPDHVDWHGSMCGQSPPPPRAPTAGSSRARDAARGRPTMIAITCSTNFGRKPGAIPIRRPCWIARRMMRRRM